MPPVTPQDFGTKVTDFHIVLGTLGGTGLAVDSDPNTTEPKAGRMTTTPRVTDLNTCVCTLTADAAATVELWMWSKKIGKWVKLFSQALTALVCSQVTNIPANVPVALIVTVNAGTTATIVAAMFN